jgi:hypothetical protein
MGNPGFAKTIFWIALLIAGAYFGMKYINEHPRAADIQKLQPGPARPQPRGGNGGGNIVVIP